MADSDILIKIETAYQSGGIEAVKKAIADVDKETKNLANTNAELERKVKSSNRELNNGQRALAGLNSIAAASRGSFLGASQVLELFGGSIGRLAAKFTLIGGTFLTFLDIGKRLDNWLNISEKIANHFTPSIAGSNTAINTLTVAVKGLNDTDLSKIRAEVDALAKDTETIAANIDRNATRREKSRTADSSAESAKIAAGITDPAARAAAIAAHQESVAADTASDQAKDALAKLLPAERQVKGIDAAIASLINERAVAGQSVQEAKDSGMSPTDPEFRARRERFARAETIVAGDIESLTAKREQAYQTYLDHKTDFDAAAKNVTSTQTANITAQADRAAAEQKAAAEKRKADQDAILAAKSNLAETQLGLATTPAAKAALTRQLAGIQGQQIESDTTAPREAISLRKSALDLQTAKALAERVGGAKYQKYQALESDAEQQQREADAARGRINIYSSAVKSARSGSPEARKAQQSLSSAKTDYSKEVAEANAARAAAAAALKEVSAALRDIGADINILRDAFKNRDN